MVRAALEGLKVADFSWVLAGPIITKHLADYGATVVRVESQHRPCLLRSSLPYKDGKSGLNRAGYYAFYNANKYSLALDLTNEKSKEVARRLVAWSDIVVENFLPGTMDKLGLGYEALRKIKPDIIMLSTSNQGQTGPYGQYACLGNHLNALAGFVNFTGWPDHDPLSLMIAYSDYFSPWFAVSALLAAVDYKRRTGKGQFIDISQFETSLQLLGPSLMECAAKHSGKGRDGNRDPGAAPHGAYRCQGEDRWCAIAVSSETEWRGFCQALNNPEWCRDPSFVSLEARKENEDKLNGLVEGWTSQRSPEEVMRILQAHGVPAGVVNTAEDLYSDPALRERQCLWPMEHTELGRFSHLGQPSRLSETPAVPRMPAPCLGEHSEYVCTQLLGMADSEFTELMNAGVFE